MIFYRKRISLVWRKREEIDIIKCFLNLSLIYFYFGKIHVYTVTVNQPNVLIFLSDSVWDYIYSYLHL